jgi:hypothetical protein
LKRSSESSVPASLAASRNFSTWDFCFAMVTYEKIRISKLEAARRQLKTAITLWFTDGDPVPIHSLAFAAYEILHAISEKRDPKRIDLIFDSALVEEERLGEWNRVIRKDANFFKHADRDGDSVIEFAPQSSEIFMLFAIWARQLCGEAASVEERSFMIWLSVSRSKIVSDKGRKKLVDGLSVEDIANLRTLTKQQFWQVCRKSLSRGEANAA